MLRRMVKGKEAEDCDIFTKFVKARAGRETSLIFLHSSPRNGRKIVNIKFRFERRHSFYSYLDLLILPFKSRNSKYSDLHRKGAPLSGAFDAV